MQPTGLRILALRSGLLLPNQVEGASASVSQMRRELEAREARVAQLEGLVRQLQDARAALDAQLASSRQRCARARGALACPNLACSYRRLNWLYNGASFSCAAQVGIVSPVDASYAVAC